MDNSEATIRKDDLVVHVTNRTQMMLVLNVIRDKQVIRCKYVSSSGVIEANFAPWELIPTGNNILEQREAKVL